jgi:hypothetical protein
MEMEKAAATLELVSRREIAEGGNLDGQDLRPATAWFILRGLGILGCSNFYVCVKFSHAVYIPLPTKGARELLIQQQDAEAVRSTAVGLLAMWAWWFRRA